MSSRQQARLRPPRSAMTGLGLDHPDATDPHALDVATRGPGGQRSGLYPRMLTGCAIVRCWAMVIGTWLANGATIALAIMLVLLRTR